MMGEYISRKPDGKKLHDPLAAMALLHPEIFEFKEVELYRERGKWGSRLKEGTNTFISVKADYKKFREVFLHNGT
jgi:pyrimidine-specific ribonucleoside hydrolase